MNSENIQTEEKDNRLYQFLLLAGIVFVSVNLRPGITSVGPLMGIIRDDIGLANWSIGFLTGLPLVAFAFASPMVPGLGKRFTNERAMIIGLIILFFGIMIRSISLLFFLFAGTLLVGLGIAICNVLLPGVVKEKYPQKVALMTAVYSTVMASFAAVASGFSIPLAQGLEWGWQLSLFFWTIPVIIAICIWIYISKKNPTEKRVNMKYVSSRDGRIWRSKLAWQVALYMGLQSSLFYIVISWLPEILIGHYGTSIATGGWLLSYTQFVGIPASFFVPIIAGQLYSQRIIVAGLGICSLAGFSGLLFGNSFLMLILSTTLIGIVLNGNFALALTLLGLRAKNSRIASELSGMAQSIGYLLAAIGPVSFGLLFDITKSWETPLTVLIVITVLVIIFGFAAGQNKYVLDKEM